MTIRDYPNDHFSISIPNGWTEMSKADLDGIAERARKLAPKLPLSFQHGFRASRVASYPEVLIQIRATGRLSESDLAGMPSFEKSTSEIRDRVNAQGPDMAALKLQIGKMAWDPDARILWARIAFHVEDGTSVAGLAGMRPTEEGALQVNCYAPAATFEQFSPTFASIISSATVSGPLKYQERSLATRIVNAVAVPSLIGVILGALIGVLIHAIVLSRRRKREAAGLPRTRSLIAPAWKLAAGGLILLGWANVQDVRGGSWLQSSAEAAGYWGGKGVMLALAIYLVFLGRQELIQARRLPPGNVATPAT
jgi:hypothetical protein